MVHVFVNKGHLVAFEMCSIFSFSIMLYCHFQLLLYMHTSPLVGLYLLISCHAAPFAFLEYKYSLRPKEKDIIGCVQAKLSQLWLGL